MKQYVIDELRPADFELLRNYCDQHLTQEPLGGLYRLPLTAALLTDLQKSHAACLPLYFALELQPERLSCELLVRTHSHVRCACMGYATAAQREWLIESVDGILDRLGIQV